MLETALIESFKFMEKITAAATTALADLPQILVVDDDDRIRDLVARYLTEHGFVVATADCAAQAREALAAFAFDAMVLDVMMPGETGLEFAASLRAAGDDLPLLLLTALGESEDRINGLESGADDYLPKPFEPRELVLRLQAILRRRPKPRTVAARVRVGRWVFDPADNSLNDGAGAEQFLTGGEATLLRALVARAGQPVTREDLVRLCDMDASAERTIDVQVTRLRRKIEEDSRTPRVLQTVRGKGYLLRIDDTSGAGGA